MDDQTEPSLTWVVAGQSGEGIDSTGEIFARALHQSGYFVHAFRDFPSRIKGGLAAYSVRAALRPVRCQADRIDFLVAFASESLAAHRHRLAKEALVVYDTALRLAEPVPGTVRIAAIPLTDLAREAGSPIMKNMVALGVSAALLGLPLAALAGALERRFGRKGGKVLEQNLAALDKGFTAAAALPPGIRGGTRRLPPAPARAVGEDGPDGGRRLFLSGNEATALGALAGGCRFYAGYPITPATEIMTSLIRHLPRFGGAAIQTEDEIAAITMAIGAGYAGVRAMTASSGPGFSLMMEALSLAGMTETPIVVVDVQRAGPSTGLPTKTEQANLNEMLYGSHGEFPRIVLAAATAEDCFYLTAEAFNLAEIYQCPVIVASDMALGLAKQTVPHLDYGRVRIDRGARAGDAILSEAARRGGYRRYAFTADGISPRAIPGQPLGRHLTTGDEHDEEGRITEDPETRTRMMQKRLGKVSRLDLASLGLRYEGPPQPELLLVGWGSTYGVIDEVRHFMASAGRAVAHLHVAALHPFPAAVAGAHLAGADRVLVVEQNATGQLAGLLRREIGFHGKLESCLRFDGIPFRPAEVLERAWEILRRPPTDGSRHAAALREAVRR